MKRIIIKNLKEIQTHGSDMDDPTEWINHCITNNYWGKPERWVRAKELLDNSNPNEPEHWVWHSEYYEDSDVLETEVRTVSYVVTEVNELGETVEVQKNKVETWVKLKADYTVEVVDLSQDYDYLLSECHRKRQLEYPPIGELGDALYWKERGDNSKYTAYVSKCEQVKSKYPLPIKENL